MSSLLLSVGLLCLRHCYDTMIDPMTVCSVPRCLSALSAFVHARRPARSDARGSKREEHSAVRG
jgi:hypothetical protein